MTVLKNIKEIYNDLSFNSRMALNGLVGVVGITGMVQAVIYILNTQQAFIDSLNIPLPILIGACLLVLSLTYSAIIYGLYIWLKPEETKKKKVVKRTQFKMQVIDDE